MSTKFQSIETAQAIEEQIEGTKNKIKQQETTIARLAADGHEVVDATRCLRELLITLSGMLHARMLAGKTEDMHAGHGASPLHP